ncbi:MAG TPA: amidophosphoribosyltransferase [Candidatus Hydrogenedentes bacterium]|nr:amidophosphoribosyltransferase [Candidatus Hydrogenedentota bacterium]
MGGFFGVFTEQDCVSDLFYGTDYHSHLGTSRGGMAVLDRDGRFLRSIHDISTAQFRSKFEDELPGMRGQAGIGVISDYESQPLIIGSHLGVYAIVTVGRINNVADIVSRAFSSRVTHFSEMSGDGINPTELAATLINTGGSFEEGVRYAQEIIDGSCSMLLLSADRVMYAARDRFGRTPVIIGRRGGDWAVTMETTALPNLGYEVVKYLGPGEMVRIDENGMETCLPAGDTLRICTFLWIYYGFPGSSYEGVNVESVRYRCGAALARRDNVEVDLVSGIPDSGTGHAIGYANERRIPYGRPFAKYTPTWPRSFMPQRQETRDLVARMKLIPLQDLIQGKRILFCEDSIVRGTQLRDTIQRLYDAGAREVHMRPACPPLLFGCRFLNFSRSRSDYDLLARRAIRELEGEKPVDLAIYADETSDQHAAMVDRMNRRLSLSTLRYQRMADMVEATTLPKSKLCTYCWDGCEGCVPTASFEDRGPGSE